MGFALTAAAEAKVRCIGNYFSATDRESLVTALRSIMQEVVSPPSLEIQAWGAGANVTATTTIETLDASGKAVPVERTLPMEYSGVLSVETYGHREWVKPFIGAIGEGEAQDIVCREEVLEKAIIRVPSLGVMAGVVLHQARLVEVTVSFEYRRYENGVLVESWDCPVRDVTAPVGRSD